METTYCPKCGKPNPAGSKFCQYCGLATPGPAAASVVPFEPRKPSLPDPIASSPYPSGVTPETPVIGQMGEAGFSAFDIWGPFAGYGNRGRHVSWLLDNLGDRAESLREAVRQRFTDRQIPGGRARLEVLTGRGIVVERRPYYIIQRGVATAGLYIAKFGQDLFISQVTYSKGAINTLRAVLLALSVLFQLFVMSQTLNLGFNSSSFDPTFLCCIGPLGMFNTLALIIVAAHMVYKFVTVKDPFMILRTPLNEFQQDDLVALEKAVEETVRQSLDVVGIDSGLMAPAPDSSSKGRLI